MGFAWACTVRQSVRQLTETPHLPGISPAPASASAMLPPSSPASSELGIRPGNSPPADTWSRLPPPVTAPTTSPTLAPATAQVDPPLRRSLDRCMEVFGGRVVLYSNSAGLEQYDPEGGRAVQQENRTG